MINKQVVIIQLHVIGKIVACMVNYSHVMVQEAMNFDVVKRDSKNTLNVVDLSDGEVLHALS